MARTAQRLDPTHCVCAELRKASRRITQLYDDALRSSGIRSTQFNILIAIQRAGEANISQLTDQLLIEQTTLTRSLQLLERRKLLKRVPKKTDARIQAFVLTPHGDEVLAEATVQWRIAQAKVLEAVGNQGWERGRQFLKLVEEVLASVPKSY